jgi:hypothetical protein
VLDRIVDDGNIRVVFEALYEEVALTTSLDMIVEEGFACFWPGPFSFFWRCSKPRRNSWITV